jgi:hypothetical protein
MQGQGWKLGGQSVPGSAADAQMTASMARSTAGVLAGSHVGRFVFRSKSCGSAGEPINKLSSLLGKPGEGHDQVLAVVVVREIRSPQD